MLRHSSRNLPLKDGGKRRYLVMDALLNPAKQEAQEAAA